jgi:phosphopantothenoylcysteine decarboxylase/phosphopantothenate--cysteine ligase
MMLRNKKILLGVCGSIAAYKSALLVRQLIKEGADVKVVMTDAAASFITPLTLSTLSKHPVANSFVKNEQGEWINHVELGLWADAFIIAPASAHTIGKLANGICDNLLCAVYLSARCPVWIAPAMDLDMYRHPSTQHNLQRLTSFGNHLIEPESGELASGLEGQGRMAEPENITKVLGHFFATRGILSGKKILLTAGPTQEPLDPVRYISNRSTGKMGYRLAEAALAMGAEVTLVSGPSNEKIADGITTIRVTTAAEMYEAVLKHFANADIVILAAAVGDYTPKQVATSKIKKKDDTFLLELAKTTDIARETGKLKKAGQITVGFALETDHEFENAQAKLVAKNFDLIVLNSLQNKGAGFGHDTNQITIIGRDNKRKDFGLKSKEEVAYDILNAVVEYTTQDSVLS